MGLKFIQLFFNLFACFIYRNIIIDLTYVQRMRIKYRKRNRMLAKSAGKYINMPINIYLLKKLIIK